MNAKCHPIGSRLVSFMLFFVVGCASPVMKSYRVDGNHTEGLAYRLPIGKVQIVATRVDTFATNFSSTNIFVTNYYQWTTNFTNFAGLPTVTASTSEVSGATSGAPVQTFGSNQTSVISSGKTQGSSAGTNQNTASNSIAWTNQVSGANQTSSNSRTVLQSVSNAFPPTPPPAQEILMTNIISNVVVSLQTLPIITTNYYYAITIQTEIDPDTNSAAAFVAQGKYGSAFDDTINIQAPNQLLSAMTSTSTDQTGDLFVQLANAAASALELSVGLPPSAGRFSIVLRAKPPPRVVSKVFNPFNPDELRDAQAAFRKAYLDLRVGPNLPSPEEATLALERTSRSAKGIFYRPLLPVTVELTSEDDHSVVSQTVLLPDVCTVMHLDILKYPLVSTVWQLSLTNGTLTGFSVTKPSTLDAFMKIPVQMLAALGSVPTNLLQLKWDIASAKTQSLMQQSNQISSMIGIALGKAQLQQIQKTNGVP